MCDTGWIRGRRSRAVDVPLETFFISGLASGDHFDSARNLVVAIIIQAMVASIDFLLSPEVAMMMMLMRPAPYVVPTTTISRFTFHKGTISTKRRHSTLVGPEWGFVDQGEVERVVKSPKRQRPLPCHLSIGDLVHVDVQIK